MALIGFPETVDERAARTVAGGVVTLAAATLVSDRLWLTAPLAYGFAARVLTGPKLSPLGQVATRVVVPRLGGPPRPVDGSPKRLAQGIGLALSGSAFFSGIVLGRRRPARVALAILLSAAGLEAFGGICLACKMFPFLVRVGLVSESTCRDCADVPSRHRRQSREAPAPTEHGTVTEHRVATEQHVATVHRVAHSAAPARSSDPSAPTPAVAI